MPCGPITSWQIEGEKVEAVTNFLSLGSTITLDSDCKLEIKRHLLLGRKAMTNLDSVLKSRDITLSTNVHIVKAMGFPVVIYGCENWTIKKAEHWRTDAFKLWCWRKKSLENPLDCKEVNLVNPKGNQSWIFIERVNAVAPKLWPPDMKSWLIEKDPFFNKKKRLMGIDSWESPAYLTYMQGTSWEMLG